MNGRALVSIKLRDGVRAFAKVQMIKRFLTGLFPSGSDRRGLPADFDGTAYLALHPDLAGLRTAEAAARHYVEHGAAEGRSYSAERVAATLRDLETRFGPLPDDFDWRDYVANYPDLSGIATRHEAAAHYLEHGRSEGRVPFRFEPDVYRSLSFGGGTMPDDVLLEHFLSVGRPAGAVATLQDVAKAEGIDRFRWLQRLDLDAFNLLNRRWAGEVADKRQALRAMVREGFDRLAPIAFDPEFDPDYDAEAHPGTARVAKGERYRAWLFDGLETGRPGTAAAHLTRLGLDLARYPDGFDWKRYGRLRGADGRNRWAMLDRVVADDGLAASAVPVHGPEAGRFLAALAAAVARSTAGRAVALFAEAERRGSPTTADLERHGDALADGARWAIALDRYGQAIAAGAVQVPVVVKAVTVALEAGRPRDAIAILERTRTAAAGDVRWRGVLREAVEAAFRATWSEAEALYAAGRRAEADAAMTAVVAEVERWWTVLDPVGLPLPPSTARRTVMLANVDLRQCTHYRVNQKVEIFQAAGLDVEVYTQAEVDAFLTALPGASAALFYRLPATPLTVRAIAACRALGVTSYYDVDDLIFDPAHYPEPLDTYGASVSPSFYHSLQMGVPLFRAAMALCDHGIASTTRLAGFMEGVVRSGRCFVLPNGIDSHDADYFGFAVPKVRRNDEVVLFYGSGTKAHNSDFLDLLGGPLLTLMTRHPALRLIVTGFLSLDARFDPVRDRVVQLGWTKDLPSYWSLLAEADINMAVLIPSPTTDCKSEIKWLEAAAMGVPSVVSATHRYVEVLEDGVDALLARDSDEWLRALDALVRSPDRRRALVEAARAKALRLYGLDGNAERLRALLAPAFERADAAIPPAGRKKRILLFNIFFPPQTVGGSTRVARDNLDGFLASGFADECDFAVMTTDNDNPVPYQLRVDDYRGVPVFRASTVEEPEMEWRPFNGRFGRLFARVLDLWRPDLVHVHSIQRGSASILVECIRAGVPYVNTVHDAWWVSDYQFLTDASGRPQRPEEPLPSNPPYGRSVGESLERRRRLRVLLERSAAILGVSDAFTRIMHEAGYPTVRSVPNGVPPMAPVIRTRSRTGRVRVVQVSGWTHHKGYPLVQAAFKQGRFGNLELTVLDHRRFGGPVHETRWGDTPVRFVGKTRQEEMHALYAEQDVLLAPSMWPESFGLVSREASAAGLWVVASDRGAVGEGIEHGVNGWVVDVSTPAAFEAVLDEIDRNPARYLEPPPASTSPARTADDQARDLVAIYRDILARPPEAAPWPYFMTGRFAGEEGEGPEERVHRNRKVEPKKRREADQTRDGVPV